MKLAASVAVRVEFFFAGNVVGVSTFHICSFFFLLFFFYSLRVLESFH